MDVFEKRYGEVLLVRLGDSGPEATVFNSFPLNDCPQELWSKLDTEAIARENDAQMVLLNGPRYWLMSRSRKHPASSRRRRPSAASRCSGRPRCSCPR